LWLQHVLPEPIASCGAVLEVVQKCVYLGQTLQLGRNNFEDETTLSIFIVDPTKPKDESQLVRSTGHDIRKRDVDTHGTAGPQVLGRSVSYGKSYARGFSAVSNPKRGDPAEN
jgi:hypothetical protein